jgi:hypothetical protein
MCSIGISLKDSLAPLMLFTLNFTNHNEDISHSANNNFYSIYHFL